MLRWFFLMGCLTFLSQCSSCLVIVKAPSHDGSLSIIVFLASKVRHHPLVQVATCGWHFERLWQEIPKGRMLHCIALCGSWPRLSLIREREELTTHVEWLSGRESRSKKWASHLFNRLHSTRHLMSQVS